jgi:hypothetical protein
MLMLPSCAFEGRDVTRSRNDICARYSKRRSRYLSGICRSNAARSNGRPLFHPYFPILVTPKMSDSIQSASRHATMWIPGGD